jgi:N-acetylglucosamine kinase-like BadF-type ATPase|tara:strand:- start:9422 stop:10276 length:855 start_codon:yes stop_codon:yes gene_type:complete
MILIADGGSTKADWIALDTNKNELFRVRTLGLNPAVISTEELTNRIINMFQLINVKDEVSHVYFYGAGCGTDKACNLLKDVMEGIFTNAKVTIAEDMLAAVYAAVGKSPGMVCILGTGSNSCYFDGENMHMKVASLGYVLMDEASGNYFGKRLIRDYYYGLMPKYMVEKFEADFNLDTDTIKTNLYQKPNPNMYLASFAKFMFDFKDEKYVRRLMKKGFEKFFKYRILPYKLHRETPIYFIGSIAHYFREILDDVAEKNGLKITGIIQRPIDNLIEYHKNHINL